MENAGRKTKVAILGGGVGAMSAAFELTSEPNWQDRYEVTLYQMGWRLGGKGASGRNAAVCQRIEEHGLHFWLGFYENAFRMIRQCYEENARPLTEALATWTEAFKPCYEVNVEDHVNGEWIPWLLSFTPNPDTPGDTVALPSLWEMAGTAIEFLRNLLVRAPLAAPDGPEHESITARVESFFARARVARPQATLSTGEAILHTAKAHVDSTAACNGHLDPSAHSLLGSMVDTYWLWIVQRAHDTHAAQDPSVGNEELRRFLLMTEFVIVNLRGMIADGVLVRGLSSIDEYDYVEWLTRHGASSDVSTCGLVRAFYDLCFSPYATCRSWNVSERACCASSSPIAGACTGGCRPAWATQSLLRCMRCCASAACSSASFIGSARCTCRMMGSRSRSSTWVGRPRSRQAITSRSSRSGACHAGPANLSTISW